MTDRHGDITVVTMVAAHPCRPVGRSCLPVDQPSSLRRPRTEGSPRSNSSGSPFSDAAETPQDEDREAARRYVEQLRAFYIHAAAFAVGMVVIFVVNLTINLAAELTGEWWAWWSGWALIGWGLGLAIHGLVVRWSRPRSSSSTWTERKINEILSESDDGPPS